MKNKRNQNQNPTTQNSELNAHKPFHHSGITLIALVVTIVVLLILAGVTITLVFGENNIFDLAKEAGNKTNEAIKSEQDMVDKITSELNKWSNGGSSGENPETPTIPEDLEVGSSVTYNLVGDDYIWNKEYATSDQTGTETLSSKNGGAFRLTQWKVLDINETTKEVTLVPTKTTLGEDGTSGKVRLQGAQGYNNSVKLLNDACSKLYGNTSKGITARSINIKDIEDHMTETALASAYSYANAAAYDHQLANAYTSANSKYPVIYAQEIDAVIGSESRKTTGLGLSDEPTNFIERSEGTSITSSIGAITNATNIQPYQTYWYKDATFMQTAFETYKEGSTYYNLIMPQLTSTTCWVASRCVNTGTEICSFNVRNVRTLAA